MPKPDADFSFDLFALVFWLISRYEEYLPFEEDQHGRFPAEQSLAYQYQFLKIPLVNYWVQQLIDQLLRKFPGFTSNSTSYQCLSTLDIDLAWAFLHKGAIRNSLGLLRDIKNRQFRLVLNRIKVLAGAISDPFFTFPDILSLHTKHQLQPHFFFLLGDYGKFDKNVSHNKLALRKLIAQLGEHYQCGIHPSYLASTTGGRLQLFREVQRLQNMLQRPIKNSRQHFLMLRFPQTYRLLLEMGIQADYTLGYASQIGFRASISHPYPWYDLAAEKATDLMIYPFQVMDVTLKQYLKLNPTSAIEKTVDIINQCKQYHGLFSLIWHNSSLSYMDGWSEWKVTYDELLKMAAKAN